jgi:hypothetical protein
LIFVVISVCLTGMLIYRRLRFRTNLTKELSAEFKGHMAVELTTAVHGFATTGTAGVGETVDLQHVNPVELAQAGEFTLTHTTSARSSVLGRLFTR